VSAGDGDPGVDDFRWPDEVEAEAEVLRRAGLTTWLTGVLFGVVSFSTAFRPLMADPDRLFTVIGVANALLLGGLWWVFRRGHLARRAPQILLTGVTLITVPMVLISGGANSQFAAVIPLFPICGVMLGGRRTGIALFLFWLAALPLLHWVEPLRMDLTGEAFHRGKAISRTLWVILASLVALTFGLYFDSLTGRLQRQLRQMAERDPLTGVANRRGMKVAMAGALAAAARSGDWVSVMILDLDRFKWLNDSWGHAAGDEALTQVARTLIRASRLGQDRVARFGGEEFVVILSNTDAAGARIAADKLRDAIRALDIRIRPDRPEPLTATVGFVSLPGGTTLTQDEILRQADLALYEGKRRGRDRTVDASELSGLPGVAAEEGMGG